MAPEYLNSNVVNFLVYCYLEEAGYHKAADRLRRSWIGNHNPKEALPFAPRVNRNALIDLIQDGLFLDRLESEAKKSSPRFNFGNDLGPRYSLQTDEAREPKPKRRRLMPPQQNRDLDAENGITDDNARPRRGPKPKRKSGSRESRINGDVMSIGANGAVQAPESAVEDAETPMDVDEELIDTTLNIGYSKETDAAKPLDLVPQTTVMQKDFPLFIVRFSPSDPSRLYLGGGVVQGNKIGEMLKLRDEAPDGINVEMATKVAEVEAFCWTAPSEAVVAIFEPTEDPHQARISSQLIRISHWGQERTVISPVPCSVLSLHYQKETGNILCLSGGESSTVHIFHLDGDSSERRLAVVTDNTFYDATWISENRFIACGERKIATFRVTESGEMVQSAEITPYKDHIPSSLIRVRVDAQGRNAAALAENMCDIFTVGIDPDTAVLSQSGPKSFNDVIRDFEFSTKDPGRFAVACIDGLITVWSATNFTADSTPKYQFYMGPQSSAMALAFSPDGGSIAAAGWGQLLIWELAGEQHQGEHEARAIWQLQGDERWNCEPTDGDQRDWIHHLSWDPQGKQIAFGLWRQFAIINLNGLNTRQILSSRPLE